MAESTDPKAPGRANGEGSIYATADGRLRGSIAWIDPDGTLRRRYVSGRTRADVKRAIGKLRDQLDHGLAPAPAGDVAAFLTAWLEAIKPRVQAGTWRGYEQCVRSYIRPALGRRELRNLSPSDVEKLTTDMLGRGLSPRTAVLARTVLRRALQDAQRDELVHRGDGARSRGLGPYRAKRRLSTGDVARHAARNGEYPAKRTLVSAGDPA